MTGLAFLLIIASALCHSSWNFLLKRSAHKVAFLGSAGVIGAVTLLPLAIVVSVSGGTPVRGIAFGCVTGCLHGVYGLALSRGYSLGDLSSVYPISRGMGLAIIPVAAALLLNESISLVAIFGIALIVAGVYAIHIEGRDLAGPLRAIGSPASRVALLTGGLIATYSLWDKHALNQLSPITLNQFAMTGHAVITTAVALRSGREVVRAEWQERGWSIVAAGVLIQLAYLLVLAALTTSRVSYIAPAREVGIVFGAILGVLVLGEGLGTWRIWASGLIVAGVLTLAVAP